MPLQKKFNHEIIWTPALTGACAIDAVGVPYPDETHEICMAADAVLLEPLDTQNLIMIPKRPLDQNKDC
jgi:isocitrate/isopropylmalate dehydrogenase